jgi:hypothetical protein
MHHRHSYKSTDYPFLGGHQQITITGSGIIKRKSPDCGIFPFCKKKSNFIHMRFSFTFFVPDTSSARPLLCASRTDRLGSLISRELLFGCHFHPLHPRFLSPTLRRGAPRDVIGGDRCAGCHCSFETAGATTCVHKSGTAKLPFVLIAKK